MILSAEAADWFQQHEELSLFIQNQADTESQWDRCLSNTEQNVWHDIWHE